MPKQYEAMRDKFAKSMSYDAAQTKAAKIYNARHPGAPVGHYKKGGLVEKRDPSSHRTPSQIREMDRGYNAQPEMERRRNEQNKARRMLNLKKGDPRDAGHIQPLDKGGKTVSSNLEPQSRKKNRGWAKDWKA